MPSATASGADAAGNASTARNREHNQGNQERKYTPEQKAAVLRIRKCKPTAFYEILDLEAVRKTATESDIKKAYRKQSLLTHPDKNGHEHADEAFKMVARAFSVLNDKEKRDKYDRFGGDPDSRFGQAQAQAQNPFGGFGQRAAAGGGMGGGMEGDGLSPEEMFARFFGGGFGGGGPFGGGGQYILPPDDSLRYVCQGVTMLTDSKPSTQAHNSSSTLAAQASESTNLAAAGPADARARTNPQPKTTTSSTRSWDSSRSSSSSCSRSSHPSSPAAAHRRPDRRGWSLTTLKILTRRSARRPGCVSSTLSIHSM